MPCLESVDEGLVALVAFRGQCSYLYQGVSASADGRQYEYGSVAVHRLGDDVHYL